MSGQQRQGYGPPAKKALPAISEAKRNAEALFETKSVAEIREIENRTRQDIEHKKLQLRQLVGDSYRDLIESADKIVAISKNCNSILSNVKSIQGGFSSLATSFSSADDLLKEKRDSLSKHEELYAVGGRVQYLVGTPEMIWGCLDSRQYLEASRRYLRAEQVHALLGSSFSGQVLAKFPLLSHQWPLVKNFKVQILETVRGGLSTEAALTTEQAADALAAVCMLEASDSTAALQLLLASRRTWVAARLAGAVAGGGGGDGGGTGGGSSLPPAAVAALLSSLAHAVQMTISQVGELFLPAGGKSSEANCQLQAAAREDDLDSSELLFGGRGGGAAAPPAGGAAPAQGGAAGGTGQTAEAAAWRRGSKGMVDRLCALSSGQVERECVQWVKGVADECARHVPHLLRACGSASSLVEVEHAVRAALAAWCHPSRAAKGGAAMKRQRSAGGAPASNAAASNVTAALESHLQTWDTLCEWVLGRPLAVWQETLHAPFVSRAKELLDGAFAAAARSLEGPLAECLQAAAASAPEPAGCIPCTRWPASAGDPAEAVALPGAGGTPTASAAAGGASSRSWSERAAGGPRSAKAHAHDDKAAFRQRVHTMRQLLDDELRSVLAAALLLLSASDAPGASSATHGASHFPASLSAGRLSSGPLHNNSSSFSGAAAAAASRAAELEPFVQQRSAELAAQLAGRLAAALAAVGAPRDGAAGAPAAEQTLLLGGFCSAVAGDSRMLPALLGAPDLWRHAMRAGGVAGGGGGAGGTGGTGVVRARGLSATAALKAAAANSRLQGVLDRFRACAVDAYKSWSHWAAASLASELHRALSADELLTSLTAPPSWHETVIAAGGGAGGMMDDGGLDDAPAAAGDMRFALPACPSAAALGYLQAACQELRRAGDAAVGPEALQVFEWELSGAALRVYGGLLRPGGGPGSLSRRVSEKGVLQLLLDARFLRDVLVGGRPACRGRAAAAAAGAAASGSFSSESLGGGALGGGTVRPFNAFDASDPEVMSAVSERKREAAALEAQLQDRLDPIDWATYEPHLWSNVQRFYHRVAIMFGSLIQLQRAHPEPSGKVQLMQEMNPLNLLPAVPRFQYLPISAPVATPQGAAAAKNKLNAATLSRAVPQQGPTSSDPAACYSFSDLGTRLSGAGGRFTGDGAGAGGAGGAAGASAPAAAGAAVLSALQARLQGGSLGSLGSFVGDKAAEMTAMAQQRFETFGGIGDYLPTAGLGSGLLSTFTTKAKR